MPDDSCSKPCKDDFHRERSRFLDAYAELEEAQQRFKQSTVEKDLREMLRSLSLIRNDLVHSHLRFAPIQGQLHAIVVNTQNAEMPAREARLVSLEDFKVLSTRLAEATRRISQKA